ncbi:MAG: cell wall-binding repeat-containing protein [Desulfitobacteriaceae bacterium]|nr:cell wall-binding repeat-containing protein [Desulfitobacteriaceae bacterium]MDD4401372.1 cell wall-binding repeat-containing protein [Desulfitobacteriaceae bacterium]
MSSTDSTIIAGETTNINIKLFQDMGSYENPFTGSVTAIISDSNGNQTIYPVSGNYTISNVTIDTPGDYSLNIVASYPNYGLAVGTLNVVNAVANVSGSLVINSKNTLSIKVTDSDGSPLVRKSITVDGSTVGTTTQSLTTLNDGTISLQMTPSSYGTVNIIHAGHVIGTIPVVPAYTQNARIGGTTEDNVSLSVEIAKSGWTEGTSNVMLTRDDQFSDALAAVPLSKKLNAPILMTDSSALDERVLAGLRQLSARNVYIIGGTAAISQSIQDSLSSMGFNVTRIAGAQRYDTAAMISSVVGVDNTYTIYLANGYGIPDAIAVSAFAAEQGSPILLTEQAQLPASTIQALTDLGADNIVLLGGEAVISSEVENELGIKYSVKRWGGYDRYDTQSTIFRNLLNTENP